MSAGRLVAAFFLTFAGAVIVLVGVVSYADNRFTLREVLAGSIAVVVAAVAGAWLRRDKRQRRQP